MLRIPNLLAGEDLPAEPQQQRSADKRARLKAAGLSLFGRKGYEATSVDEITGQAKLAVGSFYQHFRSKRQLLLVLMADLLERLSELDISPAPSMPPRTGLREMLSNAFATDLSFLGAYRAWEEAVLSDQDLARKNRMIRDWTTSRVEEMLVNLMRHPEARSDLDITGLARVLDTFFWSILAQAVFMPRIELEQLIDSTTHLIFHAVFRDYPQKGKKR